VNGIAHLIFLTTATAVLTVALAGCRQTSPASTPGTTLTGPDLHPRAQSFGVAARRLGDGE